MDRDAGAMLRDGIKVRPNTRACGHRKPLGGEEFIGIPWVYIIYVHRTGVCVFVRVPFFSLGESKRNTVGVRAPILSHTHMFVSTTKLPCPPCRRVLDNLPGGPKLGNQKQTIGCLVSQGVNFQSVKEIKRRLFVAIS